MGRYFGTDGVRGVANSELDTLLAFKIGAAAAYALTQESAHGRKAKLLIGSGDADVVAIQLGADVVVFADENENEIEAGVLLVGRSLSDVAFDDFG